VKRRPVRLASRLRRGERAQATVELAVLLPLLATLLMMVFEGGLFLAEHISVVNAAREGARYVLDGGADADVAAVTTGNSRKLVTSPSRYDVWVIRGHVGSGNAVVFDGTYHAVAGASAQPWLTPAAVRSRLSDCNTGASPCGTANGMRFVAVDVAYRHDALTGRLALPSQMLTLHAYTVVRRS
jgi:hypothetical protein